MQNKTVKIELCNEKQTEDEYFYSGIWLPAKEYEILDAYHRIRIQKESDASEEIRITACPLLPELVGTRLDSPTMDELNFFASRLANLNEDETIALKAVKSKVKLGEEEIVSIKDLINLTYGLDKVAVYPIIGDDEDLGQFVIENDIHPDVAAIPEASLYLLDKSAVGKLHRENEGGVFIDGRYVIANGYEIPEIYDGETLPEGVKDSLNYAFRLELVKEPIGDEEPVETDDWISLPISKKKADKMAKKYGVERIEDCVYLGFESAIPQIEREHFGNMYDFDKLNAFAKFYLNMTSTDKMKLKAVLSAEEPGTIEDIYEIARNLSQYGFEPKIETAESFFHEYLRAYIDSRIDQKWLESLWTPYEGKELLDRVGATITDYGAVSARTRLLYGIVAREEARSKLLDEEFELVEVLDKKALFTVLRLEENDIPREMYKYDLREGEKLPFCSVETRVIVNHGGTILTKEPLDFDGKGFVAFNMETAPNFLGEKITLREFMSGELEQTEREEQTIGGITQ